MLLENQHLSNLVLNQIFSFPKKEYILKNREFLLEQFESRENLHRGFAVIDTSNYIIKEEDDFLDFFYMLAYDCERRLVVVTPNKNICDQKLFVYFDSQLSQSDDFYVLQDFKIQSIRFDALIKMLIPHKLKL